MNFIRFLLIYIFLFNFTLEGVNPCSKSELTLEIVNYARAYRKDPSQQAEIEELRQANILRQVFALLTKYDSYNSLEDAVCGFLTDELSLNEYGYSIIDASLTDLGGKSHDKVFLVKNSLGDLCYVVKAFRNPRGLESKFLPEISALDLIQQLSMPGVISIKQIAFAGYSNQFEDWGLLLETAAKGQRIDQYVYQLGNLESDSKEREAFLEICQGVFRRMAESFVYLHAKRSSEPASIPELYLQKFDDRVSAILESPFIMQELEKHFSLGEFFYYLANVKAEALDIPVFYSYWHGDAHLGNMFYNSLEDSFYFIDVAKLHQSVSMREDPMMDGIMDLVRIEENLRRIMIGLLNDSEADSLMKSFYESYELYSDRKLAGSSLLFYRTYKKLDRLVSYARYIEEEDFNKRAKDQAVFEKAVEYFESLYNRTHLH